MGFLIPILATSFVLFCFGWVAPDEVDELCATQPSVPSNGFS